MKINLKFSSIRSYLIGRVYFLLNTFPTAIREKIPSNRPLIENILYGFLCIIDILSNCFRTYIFIILLFLGSVMCVVTVAYNWKIEE